MQRYKDPTMLRKIASTLRISMCPPINDQDIASSKISTMKLTQNTPVTARPMFSTCLTSPGEVTSSASSISASAPSAPASSAAPSAHSAPARSAGPLSAEDWNSTAGLRRLRIPTAHNAKQSRRNVTSSKQASKIA